MTTSTHKTAKNPTSLKSAAILSGVSLLIMTIAAMFAYGFVHSSIVIPNDGQTTLTNILNAQALFQAEIGVWFLIVILDLLVSYGFYIYLKPAAPQLAKQSGILRLIYTGVLAYAVVQLQIAFTYARLELPDPTQVMSKIMSFEYIWSVGLIIFGMHLLFAGRAAYKTRMIPKLWSILLMLAGCSYIVINVLNTFTPELSSFTGLLETGLMLPMTIGEVGFGIWLLVKGRKLESL